MSSGNLTAVLNRLSQALEGREETPDRELLRRFAGGRDEAAFRALVDRHGRMVLGVCRRLLPGADADDAFQATFLVLVHKAGRLKQPRLLANWLYGVAYRTCLMARAEAARRRAREKEASAMPRASRDQAGACDHAELSAALDEELQRLPDKYRAPLVLCYLEEKTRVEAARLLGVPEGTVAGHLARGRDMLRRRLSRRGLTLSALGLSALLTECGNAAVPASLAVEVCRQAASWTGAANGVVSANIAVLAKGVLKAMFLAKIKAVSLVFVVLTLLAGVAGGLVPGRDTVQASQNVIPSGPQEKPAPPDRADPEKPKPPDKNPGKADEVGLPDKEDAVVLSLDEREAKAEKKNLAPRLVIHANGVARLHNPRDGTKLAETTLPREQVQALLEFTVGKQRFFELTSQGLANEIAAAMKKQAQAEPARDLPITTIRVQTAKRDHVVECAGAEFYAKVFPKLPALERFREVQQVLEGYVLRGLKPPKVTPVEDTEPAPPLNGNNVNSLVPPVAPKVGDLPKDPRAEVVRLEFQPTGSSPLWEDGLILVIDAGGSARLTSMTDKNLKKETQIPRDVLAEFVREAMGKHRFLELEWEKALAGLNQDQRKLLGGHLEGRPKVNMALLMAGKKHTLTCQDPALCAQLFPKLDEVKSLNEIYSPLQRLARNLLREEKVEPLVRVPRPPAKEMPVTPDDLKLPGEPKAVVLSLDYVGGFGLPRKNDEPYLIVHADGTVFVNNVLGAGGAQARLTVKELEELVAFAVKECRFLDLSKKAIEEAIFGDGHENPGDVVDAPTTVIRLRLAKHKNEVSLGASKFMAREFPNVQAVARFHHLETRLEALMAEIRKRAEEKEPEEKAPGKPVQPQQQGLPNEPQAKEAQEVKLEAKWKELRTVNMEGLRSVAVTPDGQKLVVGMSGPFEAQVRLLDLASGKELQELTGWSGGFARAVSRDGNRVLAAEQIGMMVHDAKAKKVLAKWFWKMPEVPVVGNGGNNSLPVVGGLNMSPTAAAFSPDCQWAAVGLGSGEVLLYSLAKADTQDKCPEPIVLKGPPQRLDGVAFSPDGRRLAAAGDGGGVVIWDVTRRKLLASIGGGKESHPLFAVCTLAFSPDGNHVARADRTGLTVWEVLTGEELASRAWPATLPPINGGLARVANVASAAFAPDLKTLALGGLDNTVTLLDLTGVCDRLEIPESGAVLGAESRPDFLAPVSYVRHLAFAPDGRTLVAANGGSVLRVFERVAPKKD